MVRVCERTKTKADMLEEAITQYKEMFIITRREFEKVIGVCPTFRREICVY
jgi:DNA topoisomerase-3